MSKTMRSTRKLNDYPDVLDIQMTAELLGLSTKTIYKRVKENQIAHERFGRQYRIYKDSVIGLLVQK